MHTPAYQFENVTQLPNLPPFPTDLNRLPSVGPQDAMATYPILAQFNHVENMRLDRLMHQSRSLGGVSSSQHPWDSAQVVTGLGQPLPAQLSPAIDAHITGIHETQNWAQQRAARRRFRRMETARRQLQDAHELFIAGDDDSIDMGVVYAERQAFLNQVQRMPPQQDDPWCSICHAALDEITDNNPEGSTIVTLRCGHEFHQECLDPWVASPYSTQ